MERDSAMPGMMVTRRIANILVASTLNVCCMLMFMVAPCSAQEPGPNPEMTIELFRQLGMVVSPCSTDQIEAWKDHNYFPYCGITQEDFKSFKKLWKKAVRNSDTLTQNPVARWEKTSIGLRRVSFWHKGTPGVILLDEERGNLIFGMYKALGWCKEKDTGSSFGSLWPADSPPPIKADDPSRKPVLPPVKIHHTQPWYPRARGRDYVKAQVTLRVLLDKQGIPRKTCVLSADPDEMPYKLASVVAVEEWRYTPATQDGKPVEVYLEVFVSFMGERR